MAVLCHVCAVYRVVVVVVVEEEDSRPHPFVFLNQGGIPLNSIHFFVWFWNYISYFHIAINMVRTKADSVPGSYRKGTETHVKW